ncbi:hypothetical protein V2J09_017752 [Rumex salicifolius]
MHLLNAPVVSHPPAKYPFTLLPPRTAAATLNRPSSQVLLIFKPTRLMCVRAAGAAVDDGVVAGEMTFYELLGIPETVTLPEIKKAYKQLARKYHPDVSPPGWVEEHTHRFILVQQAYDTLSDPTRRAVYDRDMARGIHLVFSSRKTTRLHQEVEDRSEWRNKWQSQLSELKRRRDHHATGNSSWGAQMRRGHNQLSSEP